MVVSFLRVSGCVVIVAAALTVAAGCVQQPVSGQRPQVSVGNPDGQLPPSDHSEFTDVDSCAGRLQDIEGELLEYYRLHQTLPPSLHDLRPIAQTFGDEGNYTCPVSRQPYIYVPSGMVIEGSDRRLILYDAVPAHAGARWGILYADPYGNRPPSAWVVKIPEPLLQRYKAAPAPKLPKSQPAPADGPPPP